MIRSAKKVEHKLKALLSPSPRASVRHQPANIMDGEDYTDSGIVQIDSITRQQNVTNRGKRDARAIAGKNSLPMPLSSSSSKEPNDKNISPTAHHHTHPDTVQSADLEVHSPVEYETPVGRFRVSSPTILSDASNPVTASLSTVADEVVSTVSAAVGNSDKDVSENRKHSFTEKGEIECVDSDKHFVASRHSSRGSRSTTPTYTHVSTATSHVLSNSYENTVAYKSTQAQAPASPVQFANGRFSVKETNPADSPLLGAIAHRARGEISSELSTGDHILAFPVEIDSITDLRGAEHSRSKISKTTGTVCSGIEVPEANEKKSGTTMKGEIQETNTVSRNTNVERVAKTGPGVNFPTGSGERTSTSQGRFSVNNSDLSGDGVSPLLHSRTNSTALKTNLSQSRFSVKDAELQDTSHQAIMGVVREVTQESDGSPSMPGGRSRYNISGVPDENHTQHLLRASCIEGAHATSSMEGERDSVNTPVGRFNVTSSSANSSTFSVRSVDSSIAYDEIRKVVKGTGDERTVPDGQVNDQLNTTVQNENEIGLSTNIVEKLVENTDSTSIGLSEDMTIDSTTDRACSPLGNSESDASVGRFLVSDISAEAELDVQTSSAPESTLSRNRPNRFSVRKSSMITELNGQTKGVEDRIMLDSQTVHDSQVSIRKPANDIHADQQIVDHHGHPATESNTKKAETRFQVTDTIEGRESFRTMSPPGSYYRNDGATQSTVASSRAREHSDAGVAARIERVDRFSIRRVNSGVAVGPCEGE
ncbi:hypothetical protein SARC_08312 [Sphaeroforma arctica JP610]|uniref:Uncharacterized protein n=1 Tax=Sphaeroforma arctica JP610 TaxID=667725 RepID=A0A0L0FR50_9EUKA|nr:hypothetical protein SARC_08312 [Sphaeroforma arctica JP610]KNC79292.1 hypothetical protein SARC_08312 [Sphaeroforma arctica JP610]|eukprot:XP_014153194.1 hypothetical protein SARC_08312 [Sphaeroforma arctica JP610]